MSSTLTLRSEGLYDPLPNTAAPPLVSKFTNNYCDYLLTNEQIFWWLILAFTTLLVFTLNFSVDAGKTLNARKDRGSSLQFLLPPQRHPKESNQRPLKQSKCSIDSIHSSYTQLHNQCKLLCVVVTKCPMVSPFLKPFLEIKYKQNPKSNNIKILFNVVLVLRETFCDIYIIQPFCLFYQIWLLLICRTGIQTLASVMLIQCSTSWAIRGTGNWLSCWLTLRS